MCTFLIARERVGQWLSRSLSRELLTSSPDDDNGKEGQGWLVIQDKKRSLFILKYRLLCMFLSSPCPQFTVTQPSLSSMMDGMGSPNFETSMCVLFSEVSLFFVFVRKMCSLSCIWHKHKRLSHSSCVRKHLLFIFSASKRWSTLFFLWSNFEKRREKEVLCVFPGITLMTSEERRTRKGRKNDNEIARWWGEKERKRKQMLARERELLVVTCPSRSYRGWDRTHEERKHEMRWRWERETRQEGKTDSTPFTEDKRSREEGNMYHVKEILCNS